MHAPPRCSTTIVRRSRSIPTTTSIQTAISATTLVATAPDRLHHHDFGADLHALIKVDDVRIAHADASRRYVLADCPRLIRTMDAIDARAEIKRSRPERIVRTPGDKVRKVWLALKHFHGRNPVRPFFLCRNRMPSCP